MRSPSRNTDSAGITQRIFVVRGQRVLLDSDLAELYGVPTKRLNQQVRRNRDRFPEDFVFWLGINELRDSWLQFATSSKKYRYAAIRALMAPPAAKSRPIGFTADIEK